MANPFDFEVDEKTETPSRREIKKTLRKAGRMKPMVHPIIKTILVYTTIIILIGGGYFGYIKMTEGSVATGGATGLSKFSSSITGFFVQEPLPEEGKFGIKITAKAIDLSDEENKLKIGLKTNMTSQCIKEKNDVKLATETKMKALCQTEKDAMQEDIDYWEGRYDSCNGDDE
jgi:hypothetical protein